jgi:integrase
MTKDISEILDSISKNKQKSPSERMGVLLDATIRENRRVVQEQAAALIRGPLSKAFEEHSKAQRQVPYKFWDAIVAWRDTLYYSNLTRITKSNYLSGMLKLIQEKIIDPNLTLSELSLNWFKKATNKIDNIAHWSPSTKRMRKSCLYTFVNKVIDDQKIPACYGEPYRRKPSMLEIKFLLSIVENRTELESLNIAQLTETMRASNERDALIVSTLFFTGRSLDEVLQIKPTDLNWNSIRFGKECDIVPRCLIELLQSLYPHNSEYVFVTAQGNRLLRNQVIRSLKNASNALRLGFEITPKLLQSKAILVICREKLSELEKVLAEAT